jgi:hypothetical protein
MKSVRYRINLVGYLVFLYSFNAFALIPLQGLLYGDVSDTYQQDPLAGISSIKSVSDESLVSSETIKSFKEYSGFYQQGANLKNSCQFFQEYKYATPFEESQAKRTIVSTLQYIGLDLTMKAIVEYSKLLEFDSDSFNNLVENLIENTCSKNTTVYSLKLLKDNFKHLYENMPAKSYQLPSLNDSPYYSKAVKDITNSRQAKKKEMDLTIKNFRALCSWGGDVDNYRLLVPLLQNPFIMSYIHNSLLSKKISYDKKEASIAYVKDEDAVQISCENLVCRRTTQETFNQKLPRIVGSNDIATDLNVLYCGHFSRVLYQESNQNKQIKEWMDDLTIDSPVLEATNFISLLTKKSDLLIASNTYRDLTKLLKENIDSNWHRWAEEKSSGLQIDLLLEESLNVTLVSQVDTVSALKGNLKMVFDFTLGEADKVLMESDKIKSNFSLSIPNNFLRWMRKEYIKRSNVSDYKGLKELNDKVVAYVDAEFKKKEKYFLIPIWTPKISKIVAKELQEQLLKYKGSKFTAHHNKAVKIPVEFRFGLFALKYLNEKFKSKYRDDGSYRGISNFTSEKLKSK